MSKEPGRFDTRNPLIVTSVDVSPDGQLLAVAQQSDDASHVALGLWSLAEQRLVAALVEEEWAIALTVRFSPGGKLVAFSDAAQNLRIHRLDSNEPIRGTRSLEFVKWMSFARSCDRLIAGGVRTEVWDAELGSVIWALPVAPLPAEANIQPPCCALSPEGERVAASGVEPGCITIYDIGRGNIVGKIEHTMDDAQSIVFAPNGRLLAAVSRSGGAGVWDLDTGATLLPDLLNLRADNYWCVGFHPDGELVGLGLWTGFVEVVRLTDGDHLIDQRGHHGTVQDLAFARDGKRMFTGGDDGAVLVWDLG